VGLNAKAGSVSRLSTFRDAYALRFCIGVPSNELVGQMHDRMPAILEPKGYDRWLGLEPNPHDSSSPEPMTMWPISTRVNKPENDDPSILGRTQQVVTEGDHGLHHVDLERRGGSNAPAIVTLSIFISPIRHSTLQIKKALERAGTKLVVRALCDGAVKQLPKGPPRWIRSPNGWSPGRHLAQRAGALLPSR
jgi:SOS response associated peptidase (SRAP)